MRITQEKEEFLSDLKLTIAGMFCAIAGMALLVLVLYINK